MKSTSIQWCDDTINTVTGCDGCELAPRTGEHENRVSYAYVLRQLRGGHHKGYATNFFEPKMFPGRTAIATSSVDLTGQRRFDKSWLDGSPRLIFVSALGDAMSKTIDFPYLRDEIVNVASGESDKLTALGKVRALKQKWLWLTKQPQRMAEFSGWISAEGIDWPENLWVGTSVTTQNTCHRLESSIQVGNNRTIRFVSAEPLWEQVTLSQVLSTKRTHWVITGG